MHRTLARQLRKLGLTAETPPGPAAWRSLLEQVGTVYAATDDDRHLMNRAMETSSHEMHELMRRLAERNTLLTHEMELHAMTAKKLHFSATHDALTGLPSRAVVLDELARCLRSQNTDGAGYAVLFLDLDDFKVINDSLGHNLGDEVLKHFSRELCAVCHEATNLDPVVCRLGGDEFVVLLRRSDSRESVTQLAQRVRERLTQPAEVGGQRLTLSVSIGILMASDGYREPGELLRDADTAMYRAKQGGKGRHVVFDTHMHHETVERLRTEQDLRAALELGQFTMVYQPLVTLDSGEVHAFEALLRWNHPTHGVVSPVGFLDVAEQTGLIVPIGRAALRQVCRDLASWRAGGMNIDDVTVAVNFSRRQAKDASFVQDIISACEETGLTPASLCVELTESVFVSDSSGLRPTCDQIRSLGCKLHMDDFGTGLSSLSTLHEMPFDGVKIDRSFISRLTSRREHTAIVSSIIMLAHNLGLKVVAEGVENVGQLAQLQACDCDFGQGYLFARPLEARAVQSWHKHNHAAASGRYLRMAA